MANTKKIQTKELIGADLNVFDEDENDMSIDDGNVIDEDDDAPE